MEYWRVHRYSPSLEHRNTPSLLPRLARDRDFLIGKKAVVPRKDFI